MAFRDDLERLEGGYQLPRTQPDCEEYLIPDEEWGGNVDRETGIVVYPDDEHARKRINLIKQRGRRNG